MAMTRAEEARLVREQTKTVEYYARKYAGYGVAHEDLMQEGMIGLLAAIRAWDPERGALSTIAGQYIRSQIRKALGIEAAGSEGKQRLRVNPRQERSKRSSYAPLGRSLDAPLAENAGTLHDVVASDAPSPEDICAANERKAQVKGALERLTPTQLDVIAGRFMRGLTLAEVGTERGFTRERARQIESIALGRMRKAFA